MKRTKRTEIILWTAVALWLLQVLFLSFQNGNSTAETSGVIAKIVCSILLRCGINAHYSVLHRILRTSAHFLVFCVFGILLESAILSGSNERDCFRQRCFGIIACTTVCIVPEIIKQWIPGRHLQWGEALLNVLGAYVGMIIVYAIKRIKAS